MVKETHEHGNQMSEYEAYDREISVRREGKRTLSNETTMNSMTTPGSLRTGAVIIDYFLQESMLNARSIYINIDCDRRIESRNCAKSRKHRVYKR